MPHGVVWRPRARQDLIECADYLEREAGLSIAIRFLAAVDESARKLAAHPAIGWRRGELVGMLSSVRTWRVTGFEEHLIFYQVGDGIVRVLRILHGRRDGLEGLLQEE